MGNFPGDRTNVRVFNNTFVQSTNLGQFVVVLNTDDLASLDGFEFKNNIVARTFDGVPRLFSIGNSSAKAYDPTYMTIDSNVYWDGGYFNQSNGRHGTNQITTDPKFVTSISFTVGGQSITSPYSIQGVYPQSSAFEAGVNLLDVPDDNAGRSRPDGNTHDIGAFEVPH